MGNHFWEQWKAFWKGWGYSILIAVVLASSFKSAVADWNTVPTGSMNPTIVEGDRIFINKLAYDLKVPYTTWHLAEWDAPRRGDIVVFYSPVDGTRLVKRVVGKPGDTIAMHEDRLLINGRKTAYEVLEAARDRADQVQLMESLGTKRHPIVLSPLRPALRTFGPVTIPEGKYFMMGDNRDNSADSRYFGFVDRDRIVGRATAVVMSLDAQKHYQPRWNRFFIKLP